MESSKNSNEKLESSGAEPSGAADSTSATGIFGKVSAQPIPTEEDLLASLLAQDIAPVAPAENPVKTGGAAPPVPTPQPPSLPPAQSGPGEFTRMLQTLASMEQNASTTAAPGPSQDIRQVFSQVPIQDIQNKGSRDPEANAPAQSANPPASASQPAAGRPSEPGDFTRMFSSVSTPSAQPPASPKPAPSAGDSAFPPSQPGEFTRMFQGVGPAAPVTESRLSPAPEAAPPREPGDFTRMFSSQAPLTSPGQDSLKSLGPEPSFQSSPAPLPSDSGWQPIRSAGSASPAPPLPAVGGFTQLLQTLNQDSKPESSSVPAPRAPLAPELPGAQPGGFTQLLRTLSDQEPAPASPDPGPHVAQSLNSRVFPPSPTPGAGSAEPPVLPPMAPPAASGPGEFTRVISGSALRDLQAPGAPAQQAPAAPSPWTPPNLPKPPGFPVAAAPAVPSAAPSGSPFAPAAIAFPPPPTPAPPPPSAPQPGTLQKHLPLILVLNIFLMLAIVLMLIFVLHRK
jgi:hypothetical protein